jgi:hypothetical protein
MYLLPLKINGQRRKYQLKKTCQFRVVKPYQALNSVTVKEILLTAERKYFPLVTLPVKKPRCYGFLW